jgi:mono/diheme cytochrome c family protein
MWNKAPSMLRAMKDAGVKPPRLTAEDMANIVAYLYSVNYFAEAGDAGRGKELMTAKGCSSCHKVPGLSGSGAVPITRLNRPAAFVAALWNHLVVPERPDQARIQWPELNAQQTADLVAYLQTTGDGPK